MRRQPTAARLAKLWQARRQRLRAEGARWCETHGSTTDADARALHAETPPAVWAVLESLTEEQLEVLCAPGATARDLPELTDLQLMAVFLPEQLDDA